MTDTGIAAAGSAEGENRANGGCVKSFHAQLSHQEVVTDKKVFDAALKQLLKLLGRPLRVPNVANKQVDLYLLYRRVTAKGGLAQVSKGKRWNEIADPFRFPSSCTSRSHTLKQCYVRLLFEFEQVYFHQFTGLLPVRPTDSTKPEEGGKRAQKRRRTDGSADPPTGGRNAITPEEGLKSAKVRQRRGVSEDPAIRVHVSREGDDSEAPPSADVNMLPKPPAFTGFHHGHPIQDEESLVGSLVTGRVDSRIDCGYCVSMTINGYTFQGVLSLRPMPASQGGRSSLSYLVPTPEDLPPQTLRPSSLTDDSTSEPDKDDQARVSDTTAAGCMQAFPTYTTMSRLTEELVQTDASISYDQAEPLHADTSSVLQEGNADMNESRVGSPLNTMPSCPGPTATDWFGSLDSLALSFRAGWTAEHDRQYNTFKVSDTASDPASLHDPNMMTFPAPEHPAAPQDYPQTICGIIDSIRGADCSQSLHRFPKSANAAQMVHWQHTQLYRPQHDPFTVHGASLGHQEAVQNGHFSREGSTESHQPAWSHIPISSPSEHVMAGICWQAPSSPHSTALTSSCQQQQQQQQHLYLQQPHQQHLYSQPLQQQVLSHPPLQQQQPYSQSPQQQQLYSQLLQQQHYSPPPPQQQQPYSQSPQQQLYSQMLQQQQQSYSQSIQQQLSYSGPSQQQQSHSPPPQSQPYLSPPPHQQPYSPPPQQQQYSSPYQQPCSPPQLQPLPQQQPYSPQLISPRLNISSLVAASSQQPFISSPYAFHRQ